MRPKQEAKLSDDYLPFGTAKVAIITSILFFLFFFLKTGCNYSREDSLVKWSIRSLLFSHFKGLAVHAMKQKTIDIGLLLLHTYTLRSLI